MWLCSKFISYPTFPDCQNVDRRAASEKHQALRFKNSPLAFVSFAFGFVSSCNLLRSRTSYLNTKQISWLNQSNIKADKCYKTRRSWCCSTKTQKPISLSSSHKKIFKMPYRQNCKSKHKYYKTEYVTLHWFEKFWIKKGIF